MTYADAVDLIKAWTLAGTGLTLSVMENEPRPFTDPAWVLLSVAAGPEPVGVDRLDYIDTTPPTGLLTEVIYGARMLTMTVAVESQSQVPADSAVAFLARLQARVWLPSVRAVLGDLAFVDMGPLRVADYQDPNDDRWISRAEMDVRFTYAIEEHAADGIDPTPAIASAVVSTNYGGAVPAALEMDEEIPPP